METILKSEIFCNLPHDDFAFALITFFLLVISTLDAYRYVKSLKVTHILETIESSFQHHVGFTRKKQSTIDDANVLELAPLLNSLFDPKVKEKKIK